MKRSKSSTTSTFSSPGLSGAHLLGGEKEKKTFFNHDRPGACVDDFYHPLVLHSDVYHKSLPGGRGGGAFMRYNAFSQQSA